MARYVIDAPTLLHVLADDLSLDPDHQLVATSSIRSEALELLLREVTAGRRTARSALQLHDRVTALRIRLLGDRVSRRTAWDIALAHGWESLRDAEYLAVTLLQADALITVDDHLAAAAVDVVPLAPLGDLLLAPQGPAVPQRQPPMVGERRAHAPRRA